MSDRKKIFFYYLVNFLTFLRIIIAFIVAILIFYGLRLTAFVFFLVGVATDLLDGDLARRFDVTSKLGEITDPLADASLIYSAIIPIFILNEFSFFIKIGIVIATLFFLILVVESTIKNKRFTLPRRKAGTTINSYFIYTTLAFYIINSPHKNLIAYLTCLILALTAFGYFTNHKKIK